MTSVLIEFLLGIYFIGVSIAVARQLTTPVTYSKSVDVFKLVLGVLLVLLAVLQGVRFI